MKATTPSALSNLARKTKHGRNSMTMMLPAVCLLLLAFAPAAHADTIVMSTFDTNAEGWNAVSLNASNAVVATHAVTWNATGGNPGGHLSRSDPQSNTTYWNAPAQFLGDMSAAFGGTLTYDVRHTGGALFNAADVILAGGASPLQLFYDAAQPTTAWTPFTIPFSAGQWRVGSLSGAFATPQQLMDVLSALTALRIRSEYINGSDTGYLDNVSVDAPEPTPEPAALALMGTGLAACAFVARRKHRQHKRRQRSRDCRHAYVEPAGLSI